MQKHGLFGMNGVLLLLLTCCSLTLRAQQEGNLVLIDAENPQPFTVRIGDQLFASSSHGHLVLAHLKDSTYHLYLRFPNKRLYEQVFPVMLHQKDLGLQLKGADSTWILYNWQSKQTIRPIIEHDSSRILEMGIKREDGFSKLMAAVVDDTAVMYNTYQGTWFSKDSAKLSVTTGSPDSLVRISNQTPALKSSSSPSLGQNGLTPLSTSPTATGKNNAAKIPPQSPPVDGGKNLPVSQAMDSSHLIAKVSPPKASQAMASIPEIKKVREVNLKISRKMVFIDMGKDGLKDTITLFVYFEKADSVRKNEVSVTSQLTQKPAKTDTSSVSKVQTKNNDEKTFVAGCGILATDADLQWLRSEILKANSEPDKILAATNAFALKCFSVSQVRLLASLFVSDKARYRLMEAANQHIADRNHFRELVDMYTDKNFQKKFLAMADKRS